MININNMVASIGQKSLSEEQEQQRKSDDQAMKAVNALFKELFIIYPAYELTLRKTHPESFNDTLNATKKLWLKQFQKHKLNPKMLRVGINRAEDSSSSFFPSIGEFIDMCKPTDKELGIPDVRSAYIEACQHVAGKKPEQYSNVIVYEAGNMTKFFDLARNSEEKMFPKFKVNYMALREKLIRGEEIHVLSNALEDKSNEVYDPRTQEQKEADKKKAALDALKNLRGLL